MVAPSLKAREMVDWEMPRALASSRPVSGARRGPAASSIPSSAMAQVSRSTTEYRCRRFITWRRKQPAGSLLRQDPTSGYKPVASGCKFGFDDPAPCCAGEERDIDRHPRRARTAARHQRLGDDDGDRRLQ